MDQHVQRAVTVGLRRRGIDVLTAFGDGSSELDDAPLLDRAALLDRVLFTQDDDHLAEAARRQREGRGFAGLVYAHQQRVTVGVCVDQLELIAVGLEPEEIAGRVIYLPL